MNQLAVIDDLAARRSAAARKAVETRRARLQNGVYPVAVLKKPLQVLPSAKSPSSGAKNTARLQTSPVGLLPQEVNELLRRFELEAASDMPDWHRVALSMKQALTARPQTEPQKVTRPVAIAAPVWPDYPVDHLGSFKVRNPTIVVTFEGGEVVRAPAVSAKDKPVNIGRGLRIAIAFYQARICHRAGLQFKPTYVRQVPAIIACICEDTGEIYDAKQCTMRTVEDRKGRQNRRLT
jgi:hypothetical protein